MARRAVVWGLGRFGGGLGAVLELERRGYEVAIMDGASPESLEESLTELERRGGRRPRPLLPETPASLEGCDLLILNPAIPPHHPLLKYLKDHPLEVGDTLSPRGSQQGEDTHPPRRNKQVGEVEDTHLLRECQRLRDTHPHGSQQGGDQQVGDTHPPCGSRQVEHPLSPQRSQEINLLLERLPAEGPPRVLAVTGTNGKSSTATLLHQALAALDGPALLGGNIGTSLLLDPAPLDGARNIVLELSSFQCARLPLEDQAPRLDGLILTPISRDHLGWHGDLEAYHQAKLRSLGALRKGTPMVFDPRCPVGRRAAALAEERGLRPVPAFTPSSAPGTAWTWRSEEPGLRPVPSVTGRLGLDPDGELLLDGRVFLPRGWPCRGRFQKANLGLVLALLLALGFDPRTARPSLETFAGLPHRLQDLGSHQRVSLIDNGVSTVAETSLSALRCLREELPEGAGIHWIAGGKLKDKSLRPHLEDCLPLCASAHFFGDAAKALKEAIRVAGPLHTPTTFQDRLREALDRAFAHARPGDLLLFSPAFSSHDQYPNFEARCQDALNWWKEKRRKETRNLQNLLPRYDKKNRAEQ